MTVRILNATQHDATPEQISAGVVNLPADFRVRRCRQGR